LASAVATSAHCPTVVVGDEHGKVLADLEVDFFFPPCLPDTLDCVRDPRPGVGNFAIAERRTLLAQKLAALYHQAELSRSSCEALSLKNVEQQRMLDNVRGEVDDVHGDYIITSFLTERKSARAAHCGTNEQLKVLQEEVQTLKEQMSKLFEVFNAQDKPIREQ
jgi:hypothetical protein